VVLRGVYGGHSGPHRRPKDPVHVVHLVGYFRLEPLTQGLDEIYCTKAKWSGGGEEGIPVEGKAGFAQRLVQLVCLEIKKTHKEKDSVAR
jgi:hypothetical protein